MPRSQQLESNLQRAILSTLREIPNIASVYEEVSDAVDTGVDFIVNASVNGKPLRLLVEAKTVLYPRDVREAFWKLRSASRRLSTQNDAIPSIPMLAAGTISDGAKKILQEERIAYLDSAGSLFLPYDDLYILIDKYAPKESRRIDRPLFSGSRSSAIHALLLNSTKWFSTHELAKLAQVSPSTASVTFTELEKRDMIEVQGKGPNKIRKLASPTLLLDEWVRQRDGSRRPEIRRFYVPMMKPEGLMKAIHSVCEKHSTAYVITHEWAAQLYSPFLSSISQVKCRIFPNVPLSLISSELNAREVDEGTNLGIIESDSIRDMLFEEEIRGLRVESPILAYLDLCNGDGRAKEMAEHLRRERIGF